MNLFTVITILLLAVSCSSIKNTIGQLDTSSDSYPVGNNFVLIKTTPSESEVYATDGTFIGKTPLRLNSEQIAQYKTGTYIPFILKKDGYIEREVVAPLKGLDTFTFHLNPLNTQHFRKWVLTTYAPETNKMAREILTIQGLLFKNKLEEAKIKILEFQKDYPNLAAPYTMMGNIHMANKEFKDAKAYFLRALTIDPSDPSASRFLSIINKTLNIKDTPETMLQGTSSSATPTNNANQEAQQIQPQEAQQTATQDTQQAQQGQLNPTTN